MTHKELFKGTTYDSLEKQVGGKHYKNFRIQPAQFINENRLEFAEGNAIKYKLDQNSLGLTHAIHASLSSLQYRITYVIRLDHNS